MLFRSMATKYLPFSIWTGVYGGVGGSVGGGVSFWFVKERTIAETKAKIERINIDFFMFVSVLDKKNN